ncbi:unnamed protein product [Pleuronectes platessa]|uniref:Uncharacterized protein n=1 Tax=Pleuronectes platessa TaxID=8262 RepID=A0A9N7YD94_PLEPL|nr:unnamed protein product [Pleuronectes platessa]
MHCQQLVPVKILRGNKRFDINCREVRGRHESPVLTEPGCVFKVTAAGTARIWSPWCHRWCHRCELKRQRHPLCAKTTSCSGPVASECKNRIRSLQVAQGLEPQEPDLRSAGTTEPGFVFPPLDPPIMYTPKALPPLNHQLFLLNSLLLLLLLHLPS